MTAAADCFRREGFHRSSTSQISAAAGMRSGHIYHYFDSKEGIVERERSEFDHLVEDLKMAMQRTDVVSAIVEEIPKSAARYMESGRVSLMLEILAKAARNTEIAELIRRDDKETREIFYELFDGAAPRIEARVELVGGVEHLGSDVRPA